MATTPNFNWSTPDNTGLVKNGALDIRTLGNSIDASMADLKGGTTGQVLKKATNTDMDFVWSADSAGMTNPMTTTGDTIYSSSGSTPARLGIGSTGQVLTVAGGVPSWATPSAGGAGWTKIASSAFSSASGVSIDNCFTSTYLNYRVFIETTGASGASSLYARLRAGGSDNTTSNYNSGWVYNQTGGATATAPVGVNNASYWYLHDTVTSGTMCTLDISKPQAASRVQGTHLASWLNFFCNAGFDFTQTTQFDGITFYPASGTFTGTVAVYGYGA